MRRTAYRFLAAISLLVAAANSATAATRPHYGGTLRVMLQSAPDALDIPANAAPSDYWDIFRTLSLIGDTLVTLDAQARPRPALAVAWQSDPSARHWQFTLRRGVKFHDGSLASPAAVAQILGALHPGWNVRASADSISIESETGTPSLLAELALPRNLLLKRNGSGLPIGTGPFLVAEWQPAKLLKLAANEESWAGRPFVDAVEIEFGKSLRDQAIALELDEADIIETMSQAANGARRKGTSSALSLPVELLALVFSPEFQGAGSSPARSAGARHRPQAHPVCAAERCGRTRRQHSSQLDDRLQRSLFRAGESATRPSFASGLAPARAQSELRPRRSAGATDRRAHCPQRARSWHHGASIVVRGGGYSPAACSAAESRSHDVAHRGGAAVGIAPARISGHARQFAGRSVSSRAQCARWICRHPAFPFAGGECGERTRVRLGARSRSAGRVERSGTFVGRCLARESATGGSTPDESTSDGFAGGFAGNRLSQAASR